MPEPLALVVGLGNPGTEYARTRHNAGEDFVRLLAEQFRCVLKQEARFHGLTGRIVLAGVDLRLLVPLTFMNRSGQAVGAMAGFFRIPSARILVAYDELDLPAGQVRFKSGGGHGGHNGVRDIVAALGNDASFHRLRIGIGHPGDRNRVSAHVLSRPSADDRLRIDRCLDEALRCMPDAVQGNCPIAMNRLNSFEVT
jgi:PTH1 family peptidyl-tRNA hydrolase